MRILVLPFVLSVIAGAACGARSGLLDPRVRSDGRAAADSARDGCATTPLCGDNLRGTWRLETASQQPAGYLFMFDGRGSCNGGVNEFLLKLANGCSRDGDATIEANTPSTLRFSCDNLGGRTGAECGGDPGKELIRVELARVSSPCGANTYDLLATVSKPGSPFSLKATAVRCRCAIGWEPCAAAMPADPCAP
jgi:hypothetical protein